MHTRNYSASYKYLREVGRFEDIKKCATTFFFYKLNGEDLCSVSGIQQENDLVSHHMVRNKTGVKYESKLRLYNDVARNSAKDGSPF